MTEIKSEDDVYCRDKYCGIGGVCTCCGKPTSEEELNKGTFFCKRCNDLNIKKQYRAVRAILGV